MAPVYTTVRQAERVVSAYLSRPQEAVYFDTETSGKRYREDKLATIQLMQGDRADVVFDVRDRPEVVQALAPIFSRLLIVGHNLKFDGNWLINYGIRLKRVFDTQLAEQVIYGRGLGDEESKHNDLPMNLQAVAARRGIEMSKAEREWFYKPRPLHERPEWSQPLPTEQVEYAAKDIRVLRDIARQQREELNARGLMEVFKLEMRLLPAMVEMEHAGIRINVDGWRSFIAEKDKEASRLEGEVLAELGAAILIERIRDYDAAMATYTAAREALDKFEAETRERFKVEGGFLTWSEYKQRHMRAYREEHVIPARPKLDTSAPNLGSPAQLIQAFRALNIPVPTKKNEKGEVVETTESKALEPLATAYPVIATFLKWRKAIKFVTSFGEKIVESRDENDRIHPEYKQIGADTGRMSCTRPNFQQIPSRGTDGKRLRENVIPAPGCVLLIADLSNIEARVLANVTEDPVVVAAFANGIDLHTDTAKRVFSLPAEWGKKECSETEWKHGWSYRDIGKTLNFLLLYGGSPFKMAMELGIPPKEAEAIVESYFQSYPGVAAYMAQTRKAVWKTLSSRTLAGRARFFTDPGPEPDAYAYQGRYSEYEERRKAWRKARRAVEKQALNTPIQGTAADVMKLAAALFYERCDYRIARTVAIVHDEMVVECHEMHAGVIAELQADCMREACDAYLKVSPVPRPKVATSDHWVKE